MRSCFLFSRRYIISPSYLSSVLDFYNPSRSLRSEHLCVVGTKDKQKEPFLVSDPNFGVISGQ